MLKRKYGIINGELYYLDTERDELLKFNEFLNNTYAVERVLRNKSGDKKFLQGLQKIIEDNGQGGEKIL